MKYKIFWTKYSEKSLNEILNYIIENDSVNSAHKVYEKIKKKVNLLRVSPLQGKKVKELLSIKKKYYQIIVSPWRIIYSVENNIITILLVIDSRRDLEEILYDMIITIDND